MLLRSDPLRAICSSFFNSIRAAITAVLLAPSLLGILNLTLTSAAAQDTVGTSVVNNGFDTIDLRSLDVTLDIPVRTVGGPITDSYEWQGHFYIYKQNGNTYFSLASYLAPEAPYGFGGLPQWEKGSNTQDGELWFAKSQTVECEYDGNYTQRTMYSQPFFVDSSGISHVPDVADAEDWHWYVDPIGGCQNSASGWTSTVTGNHEGMYFDGTNFPNSITVTDKHGYSNIGGTDPDGNSVSLADNVLGQPFLSSITGGFSYNDASGTTRNVTTTTSSSNIRSTWNCPSISDLNYSGSLITAVNFPNNTSLGIGYEATVGYSGDVTGRLSSLTLPTGGTVTFTYGGGNAPGPGTGMYCGTWNDGV